MEEAKALSDLVARTGLPFVLTHNYSGYPMVRHARDLVARGVLGPIRVVQAEYAQDWLATPLPGNKQADWRGDPAQAGPGGALGDIATHAYHLATFVLGAAAEQVSAETSRFVEGRLLDDDVQLRLRWASGAALNGRRRTRTFCATRRSASRRGSCVAAGLGCRRRPRRPRGSRRAIPRVTSKGLRGFTPMRRT
jgi:predicted dehydrogenase